MAVGPLLHSEWQLLPTGRVPPWSSESSPRRPGWSQTPSDGFSLNAYGQVMQAHSTCLVLFDMILAVEGQPAQRHAGTAATIHEVLRRTPVGTPLTYRARRGETELDVVPVQ